MQIKAQISFEFETGEEAKIAHKALKPDNIGFINSHVLGSKLIYDLSGESLNSFLATVDDLLFCEIMVENVLELEK